MNFPILQTPHLTLIEINEKHLDDLFEIFSDPETMEFYDCFPHQNKERTRQNIESSTTGYAEGKGIRWGITLLGENKIIGTIGFRWNPEKHFANLGYDLNRKYWNKGIISEAIQVVLNYAFETEKIHRIEAFTSPYNFASHKVLLKNGFVKEGELRDKMFFRNQFNTVFSFSKLITDK